MQKIKIIQGESVSFTVRMRESGGDPLDLTSIDDIHVCFKRLDGTNLVIDLASGVTVTGATIGKFEVEISAAQSAELRPTENADLEFTFDFPSGTRKKIFERSLTIIKAKC